MKYKIICIFTILIFFIFNIVIANETRINPDIISVNYPNGGEKINCNSKILFKWNVIESNNPTDIYLWDGIKKEMKLLGTVNENHFEWEVPNDLDGNRFRIKIVVNHSETNYYDFSDNFFEITNTKAQGTNIIQQEIDESEMAEEIKTSDDFLISPNPAFDELNVSFNDSYAIKDVSIVDIKGEFVKLKPFNIDIGDITINISNLVSGKYFIIFVDKDGRNYIKSFVKL